MDLQGKREELSRRKGKRESGGADDILSSFPPYYQAARTHDRTETEIDFPVGLTPPNLRCIENVIVALQCMEWGWGGGGGDTMY